MEMQPIMAPRPHGDARSWAVLIDGDGIAAKDLGRLRAAIADLVPCPVIRVYGNAQSAGAWHDQPGLRFVHSGTGKNATDVLLCIEAMDLVLRQGLGGIVLAAKDGDFSHLALYLREHGIPLVAVGIGPLTAKLKQAACEARELPPAIVVAPPQAQVTAPVPPKATPPAAKITAATSQRDPVRQALETLMPKKGDTVLLRALAGMTRKAVPDFDFSTRHGGKWRKILAERVTSFAIEGNGAEMRVRRLY